MSIGEHGHDAAVRALRQDIARMLRLLQLHNDAIVGLDGFGHIVFLNQGAEYIFGCQAAEVIGCTIHALVPAGLTTAAAQVNSTVARWPGGEQRRLWHVEGRRKSGERVMLETSISEFRYGGERTVILILRDITERVEAERQLRAATQHDELTGLPNRALLLDRLDAAIERARRHRWRMALLYVDLNGLKPVNDVLGQEVGDLVLCSAADRLRGSVRQSDTVARIGGDEFIALLEEVHGVSDSMSVARKMKRQLAQPLTIATGELRIQAGIGVALYPDHGENPETLLGQAERAMGAAKHHGQPQICQPSIIKPVAAVRTGDGIAPLSTRPEERKA